MFVLPHRSMLLTHTSMSSSSGGSYPHEPPFFLPLYRFPTWLATISIVLIMVQKELEPISKMPFGPISLLVPRFLPRCGIPRLISKSLWVKSLIRRACHGDLSRRSFNEDGILNQNPIFEMDYRIADPVEPFQIFIVLTIRALWDINSVTGLPVWNKY